MGFTKVSFLVAGVAVLVFASGCTLQSPTANPTPTPSQPRVLVSEDNDPVIGSKDAKVVVIQFSDFQCPFCRGWYNQALPQLEQDYVSTGKVRIVFRDFPIASLHSGATPFALAAECAKEQGKWRKMHDKIFDEQTKRGSGTVPYIGNDTVKGWSRELGLAPTRFNQCFDSGKYLEEIEEDLQDGTAAGVNGVPAFFIGDSSRGFVLVMGNQPVSVFQRVLDDELARSERLAGTGPEDVAGSKPM